MLILFIMIGIVECCRYKINDQNYDFEILKRDTPYILKESETDSDFFTIVYEFNICGNHPIRCQDQQGAWEVLDVLGQLTDSCELIGDPQSISILPLDIQNQKGIVLQYSNGSVCDNSENQQQIGQQRQVRFNILCSEIVDDQWMKVPFNYNDITHCNLEFSIQSPAGCALDQLDNKNSQNHQFKIFHYIILILILYSLIILILNRINKKVWEIPHQQKFIIGTLKTLKQYILLFINYIKRKFMKTKQNFEKIPQQDESYVPV